MSSPVYNEGVFRTGTYGGGTGPDPLVPEPVSTQILQELPQQSMLLQRAKSVPMGTKTQRLPVLDVLPVAYWVNGDTGLEQTTQQEWKNVTLVAEELAAIVPVPYAYLDDSDVPIWDEVRPRLTEALGKLIDLAGVWGVNTPSTWSNPIYTSAVSAGNAVVASAPSTADAAIDIARLGEMISEDGYALDGFATRPGYTWKLQQMRSTGSGVPIFQPNLQAGPGGTLFGYGLSEVKNGSWQSNDADLIAGDFTKALLGLRQDINYTLFTEGVISDGNGAVVLNLMQANAVALRVTMRVAFATANPVTALNGTSATRSPFAVLHPTGFSGS